MSILPWYWAVNAPGSRGKRDLNCSKFSVIVENTTLYRGNSKDIKEEGQIGVLEVRL